MSEESVILKKGSKTLGQKIGSGDHAGQRSVSVNVSTRPGFRTGDVILKAIYV